jgi:hypothetical protein
MATGMALDPSRKAAPATGARPFEALIQSHRGIVFKGERATEEYGPPR